MLEFHWCLCFVWWFLFSDGQGSHTTTAKWWKKETSCGINSNTCCPTIYLSWFSCSNPIIILPWLLWWVPPAVPQSRGHHAAESIANTKCALHRLRCKPSPSARRNRRDRVSTMLRAESVRHSQFLAQSGYGALQQILRRQQCVHLLELLRALRLQLLTSLQQGCSGKIHSARSSKRVVDFEAALRFAALLALLVGDVFASTALLASFTALLSVLAASLAAPAAWLAAVASKPAFACGARVSAVSSVSPIIQ